MLKYDRHAALNVKAFLTAGFVAASLASLAGCTQPDKGFGDAVKHNMALQVVDPDPQYKEGMAQPGASGDHAALAVERYRKDQVKQPVTTATTNIRTTGSGQSGAGASTGGSPPR
jgi:type IV pilus biogenesis protein CpaD/CtpE